MLQCLGPEGVFGVVFVDYQVGVRRKIVLGPTASF